MPAEPDFLDAATSFLLAWAHVSAALLVTAHVLLTRRNVRAAIGWIGVAWLSPLLGALLYYAMGINRVSRRALRLRKRLAPMLKAIAPQPAVIAAQVPEHIAAIARVGDRLTGRMLTPNNAVSSLHGGDTAYPDMLDAIRGAKYSIALACYIFRGDKSGRSFVQALAEARDRGVEVRVLIDGIGSGFFRPSALPLLRAAKLKAARFMHDWRPWRTPILNMRSHKKILVVDGRIGFTGGMNIGDENCASAKPRLAVDDIQFRVEGPVVAQLMLTFAEDWSFTTGELLDGEIWWPVPQPAGQVAARGITSGPDEDIGNIENVLATAVAQARRRLRIVTPYFLPDDRLLTGIVLAAERGVEVEVLLPQRSDHRLLDWAMAAHVGFLDVPGISFHLSRPPFDHAKLVTVDGQWCAIGSPNWDVRSLRLNFEFLLEGYDQGLTRDIDRLIDTKLTRARALHPKRLMRRPIPIRLRDAAARLLLPYL